MASENDSTNRELLQMMTSLMTKVNSLSERMAQVEKKVDFIKGHLADHSTNTTTYTIVEQARQNMVSSMCFNNPYNVVFYGIPPRPNASLDESFRIFMVEMLQIEQDRALTMAIYVQQLSAMSRDDQHPPVCVSFRSLKDLEVVQNKAKELHRPLAKRGIWAKWALFVGAGSLHLTKNNK